LTWIGASSKIEKIHPLKGLEPMKTLQALSLAILLVGSSVVSAQAQGAGLSGSLETSQTKAFAKDPSKALLLGVFPGILIHGYGHFYAKDNTWGTALLAGEVLSLTAITVGLVIKENPEDYQDSWLGSGARSSGKDMILYGGLLFGLTWLADIFHAPTAAREYNQEHGLQPAISLNHRGNPQVQLAYRF